MKFSERIGVTKVPHVLHVDDMPRALKNSLWNLLLRTLFPRSTMEFHPLVTRHAATHFFRIAVDTLPVDCDEQADWFKSRFYNKYSAWWDIYNLIEFLADGCGQANVMHWLEREEFVSAANKVLESEMSGYRFVNGVLAPITSGEELESIQQAVSEAQQRGFNGVRQHLATAVSLLSQKPKPDYRNSIKESISAVEALAKRITGESGGGLRKALHRLDETAHFHKAFTTGLLNLYGYTSDEDGIRHPILDESTVRVDEAKYMLVTCSAVVNFIIAKAAQAGAITGEQ